MVSFPILPGSTIGIIGGGQLGAMSAVAAATLGYKTHIFCPEIDSPAFDVSPFRTVAAYTDEDALRRFAAAVDVVTFEFENIPHKSVSIIENYVPVRPGWEVLYTCRNRVREKSFINAQGIATAPFVPVNNAGDLTEGLKILGYPAVLKTTELGYDGKGQETLRSAEDLPKAQAILQDGQCILEGFINFESEVSVIIARTEDGNAVCYGPVENIHRDHILHKTIAPAQLDGKLDDQAREIARTLANALSLCGVMAVEMFVTGDQKLIVNELAPRPHNSGHYTLDACVTSQFEQHIRAVCGLPLGNSHQFCPAVMQNIIGAEVLTAYEHLNEPLTKLHLYRKGEGRERRKMGHITRLEVT